MDNGDVGLKNVVVGNGNKSDFLSKCKNIGMKLCFSQIFLITLSALNIQNAIAIQTDLLIPLSIKPY